MVPPSQGWFEVMRDNRGSGSFGAVGERGIVNERFVGERAKSKVI
jgi:hypothetical protein